MPANPCDFGMCDREACRDFECISITPFDKGEEDETGEEKSSQEEDQFEGA